MDFKPQAFLGFSTPIHSAQAARSILPQPNSSQVLPTQNLWETLVGHSKKSKLRAWNPPLSWLVHLLASVLAFYRWSQVLAQRLPCRDV